MVPPTKHKINQPQYTRKSLTELTPMCAVAAESKKLTWQPCGLNQLHQNQS